jgi:general secretion pathway protein I
MKTAQAGFTLVESLIAFAILSLMMVTLYQAAGTGLRSFGSAAETDRAILVAQSQFDRIISLRRLPEARRGSVADTPFTWTLQVQPAPALPAARDITTRPVLMRLTVSWKSATGGKSIHLERLVFVSGGGR